MGVKDRTKKIVKPFVNVPYWINLEEHKGIARTLSNAAKSLFFPDMEVKREETFEQAVERLGLTRGQLIVRMRQCLGFAIAFFLAALACAAYTGMLLYTMQFAASFLGMGVTALLFAFAFRYHFWYFQIKSRKLGCSIDEWWNSKLKG